MKFYLLNDFMSHINQLPFPDKLLSFIPQIYTDCLKVLILFIEYDPLEMLKQDHTLFLETYLGEFIRQNCDFKDEEERVRILQELTFQLQSKDLKNKNTRLFQHYERLIKTYHIEKQFSKMTYNIIKQEVPKENFQDYAKMRFLALVTLAMYFLPKSHGKNIDFVWQLLFDTKIPKKRKIQKIYQVVSNTKQNQKIDQSIFKEYGFKIYNDNHINSKIRQDKTNIPPKQEIQPNLKRKASTILKEPENQITQQIYTCQQNQIPLTPTFPPISQIPPEINNKFSLNEIQSIQNPISNITYYKSQNTTMIFHN